MNRIGSLAGAVLISSVCSLHGVSSAAEPGGLQPATSKTIEYRAFARTFDDPKQPVLVLLASCHYPTSGYTLGFQGDAEGNWKLLERKPEFAAQVLTYYSITTSQTYEELPRSVKVTDAHGTHQVLVENWGEKE